MRIRITKPLPATLEGFDLSRYQLNEVYDIGRSLSELLLISGYATPEDDGSRRAASRQENKKL